MLGMMRNVALIRRVGGGWQPSRLPPSGITTAVRSVTSASTQFDHPRFSFRQRHTYHTLPMHDANKFGGRTAYLREIGPFDHKRKGRLFKRNLEISQWNVDVWCAQQTLRKKWKARDWEVIEVPFALAPPEMQCVIPEAYTDLPVAVAASGSAGACNLRRKVYDREQLQEMLYGQSPYQPIIRTQEGGKHDATLDKCM